MKKDDSKKPGFDYLRLLVYVLIAAGTSFYIGFRTLRLAHSMFAGITIGLIALVVLVLIIYRIDDGRRY